MPTQTQLSAEEIGRRGEALYASTLRALVERPENRGKYLSLDIDSGEYEIGPGHLAVVNRLLERLPNAVVYTLKIGYPAVAALGNRLRPNGS